MNHKSSQILNYIFLSIPICLNEVVFYHKICLWKLAILPLYTKALPPLSICQLVENLKQTIKQILLLLNPCLLGYYLYDYLFQMLQNQIIFVCQYAKRNLLLRALMPQSEVAYIFMTQQNHFYKNNQLLPPTTTSSLHFHLAQDQINQYSRSSSAKGDPIVLDMLLSHHIARLTTEGYDNIQLLQENIRLESGILAEIDRIQRCCKEITSQRLPIDDQTPSKGNIKYQQMRVALQYLSTGFDRQRTLLKRKSRMITYLAKLLKLRNLQIVNLKKQLNIHEWSQSHLRDSLESFQRQLLELSAQKKLKDNKTVTSQSPIYKDNETQIQADLAVKTAITQLAFHKLENIKIDPSLLASYFTIEKQLNQKIQPLRLATEAKKKHQSTQTFQNYTDSAATQTQHIIQPLKDRTNISLQTQTERPKLSLNRADPICIYREKQKHKLLSIYAVIRWQWQGQCEVQIETAMTEEDQTLSKFSYVSQQSNEGLLYYIKEISRCGSEVDYNEEAIRSLQKMGQQNQVSKAFARLLKENKCLKICLNKLIDSEREQEERNNSRILQLLQQPTPSKTSANQQSECKIY